MLAVPGGALGFGAIQNNVTGQPVGTVGTVLAPTVGSKGAWAQVFASLDSDTYGLWVQVHNGRTSAANRSYAIDVGVGAAGSETVIIPDLIGSNASTLNDLGPGMNYYFPVFIPAGTRVSVRAQGSVTTSVRVNVRAMQQPSNPAMVRTVGYVEEIGLSGIVGTTVTPGTTAEGSWTLVGTTGRDLWWWQLGVQVAIADTTHTQVYSHWDVAVGDGTNFRVISADIPFQTATVEQSARPLHIFGCESFVPAGSSIYVRGQLDVAGDAYEVAVYGAG